MSNKKSSEYKIAIFGAIAGVIVTAIYDGIKSKPILSTLFSWLKWIWKNIFEFEVAIWQVLAVLILLIFIFFLILRYESKGNLPTQSSWLSYETDKIQNVQWKWYWNKNYIGKWEITDLRPVCGSCGTKMHLSNSSWDSTFAECPRCDKKINGYKDTNKVESVILDNVHRDLYPKKDLPQ